MKTMRIVPSHRAINLAVAKAPATDLAAGSAERVALYHTARWQHARRRFLAEHPLCVVCEAAGYVIAAVAVDHRDGHCRTDWRPRFWDETTWQGLCTDCHNQKSARELAAWNRGAGAAVDG
jgi:5-methylcytosine-specific restriction endonuclease McrA